MGYVKITDRATGKVLEHIVNGVDVLKEGIDTTPTFKTDYSRDKDGNAIQELKEYQEDTTNKDIEARVELFKIRKEIDDFLDTACDDWYSEYEKDITDKT